MKNIKVVKLNGKIMGDVKEVQSICKESKR